MALSLIAFPAFAGNTIDDMLTVKKVEGQQAVLEGKTAGLKAGDKLYYYRSPFQFPITAVNGNQVTVTLPANSEITAGQNMVRQPTDSMKKAMDTEEKLKKALEE